MRRNNIHSSFCFVFSLISFIAILKIGYMLFQHRTIGISYSGFLYGILFLIFMITSLIGFLLYKKDKGVCFLSKLGYFLLLMAIVPVIIFILVIIVLLILTPFILRMPLD